MSHQMRELYSFLDTKANKKQLKISPPPRLSFFHCPSSLMFQFSLFVPLH
eukprot:c28955_g1_i2 orf=106-255(+)